MTDTEYMGKKKIKNCARCNQQLRIPKDIGGMLMECPSCGHKFHTDFKLSLKNKEAPITKKSTTEQPKKITPGIGFRIVV